MDYKVKGFVFFWIFIFLGLTYAFTLNFLPLRVFLPLSFLLCIYYFSLAFPNKRKRIAFYITWLWIVFLVLFFIFTRASGEDFLILFYVPIYFLGTMLVAILLAQFSYLIEKVKYSFLSGMIVPILILILTFLYSLFNPFNLKSWDISFYYDTGILYFPVLLFIHLITNIVLNVKQTKEDKKIKILFIYLPIIEIIFPLLLLIFIYVTRLIWPV